MTDYKGINDIRSFRINSNTWMLDDLFGDHMYLLTGNRRALLIDSGCGSLSLRNEIERLTDLPVDVLLTHGHIDHIGGAAVGGRVYLSEKDKNLYKEHIQRNMRKQYLKEQLRRKCSQLMSENQMKCYCGQLLELPICNTPVSIGEGAFDLGERKVKVIPTPGHTKGSLCVWDEESHMLFSGDTVCKWGILLCFSESASLAEYRRSLERISRLSDISVIYGGHHAVPDQKQLLEQYIELADMAKAGMCRGKTDGNSGGRVCQKGEIRLFLSAGGSQV